MIARLAKESAAALGLDYKTGGPVRKSGCHVLLRDAPTQRLIIDIDKSGSRSSGHQVRCDYLFIADGQGHDGWVVPMELKRGALDAEKVHRQLTAGAALADKIVPRRENIRFRPTAAYGSIRIEDRNKLKRARYSIKFRGQDEPIRLLKCGTPLKSILCP